jgi:peptidoglycan/xylan/chitin deacetylase (PgdA/CDA1 family)
MLVAALFLAGCAPQADDSRVERNPRTGGDPPIERPTKPDPTDPTDPTDPADPGPSDLERRWDCSGIDPADPAPLGGRVALTFDDGPHEVHTASILDTLRARGVPATFFVLGERVADPDTWPLVDELIADPLFDLANHSWDHANMTSLSLSGFEGQVDDTNAIVETFGVSPTFFRFPYGASECDHVDEIGARDMRVAGWHVDTADWCYAAVGATGSCRQADYWRIPTEYEHDMLGFTMEQVRRFDGGVILLHDIHAYTADSVDDLIDALLAEGFVLTSLSDLMAFPLLNAGTPADLPYLGEACDTTDDRCWQIEYQSWCEPTHPGDPSATTGVCVLPCEGLCYDRPGAATTFCATVEPGAGLCVGRSESRNDDCDALPGTVPAALDRWVGDSGVSASTAEVCVPPAWR